MKSVEKLAEEYSEYMIDEYAEVTTQEAYVAGFRKAREMAYELMRENADKRIFTLDVDVENLGEEEV